MVDRIIRLKDGTEYPCEMCGMYEDRLWIEAVIKMAEAWTVFTDKARIETITDTYAGEDGKQRKIVWEGYTELFLISDRDGITQIGLRKDDVE